MSSRFEVIETSIRDLKLVRRKPRADERGYLERLYCEEELRSCIPLEGDIVQINHTLTRRAGVVRGMHFQHSPNADEKLITCVSGKVYDVAVDLRVDSPTFLCWHGQILTPGNHSTLFVPAGFAHGFQAEEPDTQMLYFHTSTYRPELEDGLNPCDPALAIKWPRTVTELSDRDSSFAFVENRAVGLQL